jgi:hypothetical protein
MRTAKPSPGPWTVEKAETLFTIVAADGTEVAKTSWHLHCRGRYPLKNEAWANALLAAAATDLIEALRLHLAYEQVPADRGGANGPKGKAWAAYVAARDHAVAKAEGRS